MIRVEFQKAISNRKLGNIPFERLFSRFLRDLSRHYQYPLPRNPRDNLLATPQIRVDNARDGAQRCSTLMCPTGVGR